MQRLTDLDWKNKEITNNNYISFISPIIYYTLLNKNERSLQNLYMEFSKSIVTINVGRT